MLKYLIATCVLLLFSSVYSQTPDNLACFSILVDSIVHEINIKIPSEQKISLKSKMPEDYFVFSGRIITGFKKAGREITTANENNGWELNIILDKAGVEYSDVFREKLFGDFKVKRIITLQGNYNIIKHSLISASDEIYYQKVDTVYYDDIRSLENNSLPYTRGKIPSEPVFSSLLEPVIAISAAALTVILFFTVRSK